VLHLLEALQVLQVKVPGGGSAEARRLSFRALDIEQIGHVYEGLLDHTAKRATEPYLGLVGAKDQETEIPLAKLEELRAKGEKDLFKFLKDETGRSEAALKKALKTELDPQQTSRFRTACQGNEALWKRVQPFAGLVRFDTFGYPVVIPTGSVFVTQGTDRRSSGTHYTPRSLTEPIVQYTLEPLVYAGPAEGKPKEDWTLRSARELLDLKVCDMACGSGAFLVQACRYLSERLLEAWEECERQAQASQQGHLFEKKDQEPVAVRITPFGLPSQGGLYEQVIPLELAERQTYARRIIAQRCLYGVDKNPLAVEMAKLSLWLLTLAKDKPFEFLDHAIRCGDSLVGIHDLDQLKNFNLDPSKGRGLFTGPVFNLVDEAVGLRQKIETMPSNSVEDVEAQEKLLGEAEEKTARLRCAADLLLSVEFQPVNLAAKDDLNIHMATQTSYYVENGTIEQFREAVRKALNGQRTFHWPLEFPEVFQKRGGFDAFIGNPPFIGNKYWAERLGVRFQKYAERLIGENFGKIDAVALFFRRAFSLVCKSGKCGLIATTSAREGTTLRAGFSWISENGDIYRAVSQMAWPGIAGVHICIVWFSVIRTGMIRYLDENQVPKVPPSLTGHSTDARPLPLVSAPWGSEGSHNGKGECFLLTPGSDWFQRLMRAGSPFLRPYLTGEDITDGTFIEPQRWCVDSEDLLLC
jgi:hypothetical protein